MLRTFLAGAEVTLFFFCIVVGLLIFGSGVVFCLATIIGNFEYVAGPLDGSLPTLAVGEQLVTMNLVSVITVFGAGGFLALLRRTGCNPINP